MLSAFRIYSGYAPLQGPKALRVDLDFSTAVAIDLDFDKEQEAKQIDFIQSLWVECKDFPTRIDLDIAGVPHALSIPAFCQGVFPIYSGGTFRARITTSGTSLIKPVFIFMNVPQPYFVYTPGV